MKRYVGDEQVRSVPALPEEILRGSAVARLLWQGRGRRDGTTLPELSATLKRNEIAIRAQIRALRAALLRLASPWALLDWRSTDADTGEPIQHYLLICPIFCPRPAARPPARLTAPELISLTELEEHE